MRPRVHVAHLLPPTFYNCNFRFFYCFYPPVSDHLKYRLVSMFTVFTRPQGGGWWWGGGGGGG